MGDRFDELLLRRAVVLGKAEVIDELLRVPAVVRLATVTRLRSFGDSWRRFQTWPNRTSSVSPTSAGAKSPNIRWAPDGSLVSVLSAMWSPPLKGVAW